MSGVIVFMWGLFMLKDSLLKLFHSAMAESSLDSSLSIAGDMIEQGVDMPDGFEGVLIRFLENKDSGSFVSLSKEVLGRNLLNDYIESIKLNFFFGTKGVAAIKGCCIVT